MPTGYTAGVADGTISTFHDYALQCARAFGATIMMRDEPMDAPIPRFEVDTYHQRNVARIDDEIQALLRMTPYEAQIACQKQYRRQVVVWCQNCDHRALQRLRYQTMLDQARAWRPPTPDHEKLHEFMIQQLAESIDFDTKMGWLEYPRLMRWEDWLSLQVTELVRRRYYHRDGIRDEIGRTDMRNSWVQALRDSLEQPA